MIKQKLKVAIFGGSFNPPHLAHQFIAKEALKILDIDKLIIVPTYQNPLKKITKVPGESRVKWCKEVFNGEKIEVSSYEIENRISYTYESLEYFLEIYDVAYLLIGADNLKDITKWQKFEWINDTITWVIFQRSGEKVDLAPLKNYIIVNMNMDISSSKIREDRLFCHVDKKIENSVKNELTKE